MQRRREGPVQRSVAGPAGRKPLHVDDLIPIVRQFPDLLEKGGRVHRESFYHGRGFRSNVLWCGAGGQRLAGAATITEKSRKSIQPQRVCSGPQTSSAVGCFPKPVHGCWGPIRIRRCLMLGRARRRVSRATGSSWGGRALGNRSGLLVALNIICQLGRPPPDLPFTATDPYLRANRNLGIAQQIVSSEMVGGVAPSMQSLQVLVQRSAL